MPLVLKDRVKETTTTVSTGTYTLAGAVVGYQAFSVIGNGNTTYYAVTNGTDWEVGIGTYTLSGTTLSRDTILESSNSGNAVNWGAGVKDIFCTYPAERSIYVDGTTITPAISARLGFTNLAQGSALSVLGVTGNATADNASIAAGTDHQVLRRSGTSLAFGAVNLAQSAAVTGVLPATNGGTGVDNSTRTITISSNSGTFNFTAASKTLGISNSITLAGTDATTMTFPGTSQTIAGLGLSQTFTAAQTFRAANAIRSEAASTQDAIVIAGRAGGTSSRAITLTPASLGASRTATLPDPGADYSIGFRNIPQSGADKTTSYSLTVDDVGEFVGVGTGGSITIPNSTFAAGDAVLIFNNTAGDITITCTITTAYIAGTDVDKATVTLATRGVCNILFISGTVCVLTGNVS
jgi:hypothetical protein